MSSRERLETAIWLAHSNHEPDKPDPLLCRYCDCDLVVAEYRAALGWVPVSCHYAPSMETTCPALLGGIATWEAHEALWAALDPYLSLSHYGEVAEAAPARDVLARTP